MADVYQVLGCPMMNFSTRSSTLTIFPIRPLSPLSLTRAPGLGVTPLSLPRLLALGYCSAIAVSVVEEETRHVYDSLQADRSSVSRANQHSALTLNPSPRRKSS